MYRSTLIGTASLYLISFMLVTIYGGVYPVESIDSSWRDYTEGVIQSFYGQAGTFPQQIQFAGLFFYSGEPTNLRDSYRSIDVNGNTITGTSFDNSQQGYPNPERAINYRIASEEREGSHPVEELLQQSSMQTMYNNYVASFGAQPHSVVLFLWSIPCGGGGGRRRSHNCRQRIVNMFSSEPLIGIRNRYIVYNREGGSMQNFSNSMRLINIDLIGPVNYPHPTLTTIFPYRQKRQLAPQTFHACLSRCYGWHLGACATDKNAAGDFFVYLLMYQIKSAFPNVARMQSAAISWIRENVAMNCKEHIYLESQTNDCIDRCTGSSLSASVVSEMAGLVDPSRSGWSSICKSGMEGVFCSKFKRDSVTVGGRPGASICGRHDGYSYSWARTAYDENWDYCCETECACGVCRVSADKSSNCGSPGFLTVNGVPCNDHHPCGLHGKDYYWCNTRLGWDYCCWQRDSKCTMDSSGKDNCDVGSNPAGLVSKLCGGKFTTTIKGERCQNDHPCSTHGESYYWCYKATGSWDYCCNPYQQCNASKTYNGRTWCSVGTKSNGESPWQYCAIV